MAKLYKDYVLGNKGQSHRYGGDPEKEEKLKHSYTVYVGNLSFYTTEEQVHELFSKCGEIRRIIMGLDKFKKTPCGFCFVEYMTHEEAGYCVTYLNQTKLDDRIIRIDWDVGFENGRQYGRGKTGGQVRDEFRTDYDPGRGGYGKQPTPTAPKTQQWVPKKRERDDYQYNANDNNNGSAYYGGHNDANYNKRPRDSNSEDTSRFKRDREHNESDEDM